MSYCQEITDKSYESLRCTIRILRMDGYTQISGGPYEDLPIYKPINDFKQIKEINRLLIRFYIACRDKGFENVRGIQTLSMYGCVESRVDSARSAHGSLPRITNDYEDSEEQR